MTARKTRSNVSRRSAIRSAPAPGPQRDNAPTNNYAPGRGSDQGRITSGDTRMYDDFDDARKHNRLWWGMHTLWKYPDLFACWCHVDETNTPWALGLFDEDFDGSVSIYGRHYALIFSYAVSLTDLPVRREDFSDAHWDKGLCLTVEH